MGTPVLGRHVSKVCRNCFIFGYKFKQCSSDLLFEKVIPNVEAWFEVHTYWLLLHHLSLVFFNVPIFNIVHFVLFNFSPDTEAYFSSVVMSSLKDVSVPLSIKLASSAKKVCFI